jgi:phenylpropionate dioxygenase-like ring-hydroxylating dioxygenase large terminal subunit
VTDTVDLVAAADVAVAGIVAVSVDDLDLVVWRTAEAVVCVMDARCPHQWSHLAAEGAVVDDEIVCLAHFWRFDTAGRGVKVAMNGRRDRKGDIGVYSAVERDGRILADL